MENRERRGKGGIIIAAPFTYDSETIILKLSLLKLTLSQSLVFSSRAFSAWTLMIVVVVVVGERPRCRLLLPTCLHHQKEGLVSGNDKTSLACLLARLARKRIGMR